MTASVPRTRLEWLIGWLPVGALFVVLILSAHRGVAPADAVMIAARMVIAGALLGLPVFRLTRRVPWPEGISFSFVAVHALAAPVFAVAFVALNSALESALRHRLVVTLGGPGLAAFVVMGVLIYVMVAGVAYATTATARAERAEATAARSQLQALRSQLNPHFLFNALHTVVQLIPIDPARASRAAEEVAALLRATIEESRDLVTLEEELTFVRRYLDVERMRFGDRLIVEEAASDEALDALVPVFAVQTLIENAVRHGAAPRVDATTITVTAALKADTLTVTVRDNGAGAPVDAPVDAPASAQGTGLRRLRERLEALYGATARLSAQNVESGGFVASLSIPLDRGADT